MKAIIYTSNTGATAEYAKMLSEKTGIPAFTLEEAKSGVERGEDIIYMGWLRAGGVMGYKKALRSYNVLAVCAVGITICDDFLLHNVKMRNKILQIPLFYMQGSYRPERLKGLNRYLMRSVAMMLSNKLMERAELSDDERRQLEVLKNGGSFVDEANLEPVLGFIRGDVVEE